MFESINVVQFSCNNTCRFPILQHAPVCVGPHYRGTFIEIRRQIFRDRLSWRRRSRLCTHACLQLWGESEEEKTTSHTIPGHSKQSHDSVTAANVTRGIYSKLFVIAFILFEYLAWGLH